MAPAGSAGGRAMCVSSKDVPSAENAPPPATDPARADISIDDTAAADPQRAALDDIHAAGRVALGEQHLSARQRDKRLLAEEREDIAVFGGGRNVFRRLAACGGNTKPPPRGGA